jgi:Anti-sigma-K factor rskA/Putative zinc-finger
MTELISHDEVAELLGAYAIDAIDPGEAELIREHLDWCPRCAAEVAEHRQVAALLANSGGPAPAHLWEGITARLEADPHPNEGESAPIAGILSFRQPESGSRSTVARSRRHRALFASVAGIAAAVVLIAMLGVQIGKLDGRVGRLQQASTFQGISQTAQSALSDPEARRITLTAANSAGPAVAEIAILPSGTAFVVADHLPALPAGETYQLWGRVGNDLISLGLLGNLPHDVEFLVDPSATISAFAITAERAGGVVQTTHVPVAVSPTLST